MKRVRLLGVGVVVALLLLGGVVAGVGASAAGGSITKVGWWTRSPAARAPDGGFNVGNAADGPVSVAAVEVSSSTGLKRATLVLTEEGGIQADSAKLAVCATPNEWDAGAAQPMADAPKAECDSGQVELARNASSSTWAADVSSLLSDIEDEGVVSLMIVPSGAAAVPVAFEVRFQKPELSSEVSASSSSTDFSSEFSSGDGSSSFGSSDSGSSSSAGGFSNSTGNSSSDLSTFGPTTFNSSATVAPVAPTAADGAAGAVSPAGDGAAGGTTATTAPAELAALPTQAGTGAAVGGGNHAVQALFFVFLATIAGTAAGAGRWFVRNRTADSSVL